MGVRSGDGAERWAYDLAGSSHPETVNTDGSRLYVTTESDLSVLAADSGARCWRANYRESYASGVAVADGGVYVPADHPDGQVTTFDAETGDVLGRWDDGEDYQFEMGPALADGALYTAGRGAVGRFV